VAIEHYAGIPCALTVMPAKSFATVGGIIEINLIALVNDARRRKEVIVADLPEMAACVPHLKVGEFLLPSGLMAVGYDGRITGSDVSSSFVSLAHGAYTQAAALYGYVEALRHAAGPAMDRLLRAQYFVADVAAFSGIATARSSRYGTQAHPFLCVQTPSPMPAPGCALIGDFWISTATP
jgi:enamine deaminase RidA (YjgF/YER057c/UK114 family)